ncbi:MAG: hypothetical protein AAGA48_12010 [Myxococcota bacterium]
MRNVSAEPPIQQRAELAQAAAPVMRQMLNALDKADQDEVFGGFAAEQIESESSVQTRGRRSLNRRAPSPPPAADHGGFDVQVQSGRSSMWFYTVEDGQRVIVTDRRGNVDIVEGPKRILTWGRKIRPMNHYVAHPGDFLVVRFRDGSQQHLAGPAHCWFDPRIHLSVDKEEAVQLADKEAVVVYSESEEEDRSISRRIEHGPATLVPGPGEWLHTFVWHGPSPDANTFQKVPGGLTFQKLWLMPDQMYHDVVDVRTADDAVLTIRLMLFFELVDIERMLVTTHDPIGDFVNAATSDVIDFVGQRTLDAFKSHTTALNTLDSYPQLVSRATQCGYRIDKVVYRGYGAPPALQRLHDEATESRVRLQLERATQQQAEELEDFKLDRRLSRADKEREEERSRTELDLELQTKRNTVARQRARLDAEQTEAVAEARDARQRRHLAELSELGVDLTKLLTKTRPNHTIEVVGNAVPHLHLDEGE